MIATVAPLSHCADAGPGRGAPTDVYNVRTRVKICGITSADDARLAVAAGADALGVVFFEPSPRSARLEDAAAIRAAVPPFVSLVLVTVDLEAPVHRRWIDALRPDVLQFHGDESPAWCEGFSLPYIKSLRMRDDVDIDAFQAAHADARAVLLDTFVPGVVGGTGRRFDWRRAATRRGTRVILAGGLDALTVADAIEQARPYAVDVSSSLEASPGVKDPLAIEAFMRAVRDADDAGAVRAAERETR